MGYEGGNWDLTAAVGSGDLRSSPAQGTSCQPAQPAQDLHREQPHPRQHLLSTESRVPDPSPQLLHGETEAEGVTHSRGDTQASRFPLSSTSQRKSFSPWRAQWSLPEMPPTRGKAGIQALLLLWDWLWVALWGSPQQRAHHGSREGALPWRLSQSSAGRAREGTASPEQLPSRQSTSFPASGQEPLCPCRTS